MKSVWFWGIGGAAVAVGAARTAASRAASSGAASFMCEFVSGRGSYYGPHARTGLGAPHRTTAPVRANGELEQPIEVGLDARDADVDRLQAGAGGAHVEAQPRREVREENLAPLKPAALRRVCAAQQQRVHDAPVERRGKHPRGRSLQMSGGAVDQLADRAGGGS